MLGRVAFANDHKVVLKISEDVIPYREGQRIIVSVQNARKTASGRIIKVGEIIAYGKIADISRNTVTIHSKIKSLSAESMPTHSGSLPACSCCLTTCGQLWFPATTG